MKAQDSLDRIYCDSLKGPIRNMDLLEDFVERGILPFNPHSVGILWRIYRYKYGTNISLANPQVHVSNLVYSSNPQKEDQQQWRAVYQGGCSIWNNFSNAKKKSYTTRAKKPWTTCDGTIIPGGITGFNLFLSEYLSEYS